MPQNPELPFAIPSPEGRGETAETACLEQGASYLGLAEVLQKHTDRLMAMEGVVMVAQGRDVFGRDCITVGVKTARYVDKIPNMIEDVPTCVTVVGEVDAL